MSKQGERVKRVRPAAVVAAVMLVVTTLVLAQVGPTGAERAASAAPPTGAAREDAAAWSARQDDYLAWATAGPVSPGRVPSILAHAERARRDPTYVWDTDAPDPSDFTEEFAKLDSFQDTGDFDINKYLFLLAGWKDQLRPDLAAALEDQVLSFKYWWTEPTPPGIVDSQYYWTENHLVIFLANELIAGQLYPDATFTNSGMTGAEHMAHARPLLEKWMAQRARFGFSEWLSNIYFLEDIKGLLLLADWAEDPEITRWATALLDMVLIELAANTHNGVFGSTHGRTYEGAKTNAFRDSTWGTAKLVFDNTPHPYQSDNVAILATARRYRPPAVAGAIARDPSTAVVRQHQGLPLDPTAPITPEPVAPYGLAYDDVMTWWAMGAQFPWQTVPLSVDMLNTYDLWETTNFQQALDLKPIVDASSIADLQNLASVLSRQLNPGLLSEVDTVTWRTPEAMLSTAQDWRPGQRSEQSHIAQATLGPQAQVFTTHPTNTGGGYWTGYGATPRAAQEQNVNISIYAPQYEVSTFGPLAALNYLDQTHAFFPTERFDEVVERDGWVIGREGDGYVALWSARPTTWRPTTPDDASRYGLTERFDLQALGGADNVWITEVGRAADWPGAPDPFAAFVEAIATAPVSATPIGGDDHVLADGYDVTYTSPTRGEVTFGWAAPLTVAGQEIDLHPATRWSSPWVAVAGDSVRFCVAAGAATLDLDFTELVAGTTFATPPAPDCGFPPEPTTTTTTTTPPPATDPPVTDPPVTDPPVTDPPPPSPVSPAAVAAPVSAAPSFTG